MFRIILFSIFIVATYFWGDWRNWRKYLSSIYFLIIVNLMYKVLFYNYLLWRLEPIWPLQNIFPKSSLIVILVSFIIYPTTTLLYLGNYPEGEKQLFYIAFWVILYLIIEAVAISQKAISYHNGWNYVYTMGFDIALFLLLRLHYKKPLLAWLVSFSLFFGAAIYFNLPLSSMK